MEKCLFQHAMSVMGISEDDQYNVMCIVAGILHMGNITFREQNNYAAIVNNECKSKSVVELADLVSEAVKIPFWLR